MVGLHQDCPLSPFLSTIFMDRISRHTPAVEGVKFCGLPNPSLLGQFEAKCQAVGIRISKSKSEAMVLSLKRVDWPLWVGGELLPQAEEFKYHEFLFTSEGRGASGSPC